ncbi:MAG: hypothetical protein HYT36_02395 [Candidatus Staskawiczbacteria bacterium]|nr:hypothetical protein [Candidatus Staskawiczbacteria bacterium]
MKRICLAAMVFLIFDFGTLAFSQENSPHFFGKLVKPQVFFQKTEPMEFFMPEEPDVFEKIKDSAKRLFGKRLKFNFFFNKGSIEKFSFFDKIDRIRIEIEIVFRDENK